MCVCVCVCVCVLHYCGDGFELLRVSVQNAKFYRKMLFYNICMRPKRKVCIVTKLIFP